MDGGSTDDTVSIARKYRSLFKKNKIDFIFVSEKDNGQADAINKGFNRANGEVLAFLNSDDYYEKHILQSVVERFKNKEILWGYGGWNFVGANKKKYKSIQPRSFSKFTFITYGANIGQPSVFFKRKLYEKVGGLNTRLHLAMDYDLWLRFLALANPIIIPRIVSNMRYYSGTKSAQNMYKHNYEAYSVAKKYLPKYSLLNVILDLRYLIGVFMILFGQNVSQKIK